MNSREMQYWFKEGLNKLDSKDYTDLLVPQIDMYLNQGESIFIQTIAEPRVKEGEEGFEVSQRTIDDIRTIVVNQTFTNGIIPTKFTAVDDLLDTSFIVSLPTDYRHKIGINIYADKNSCKNRLMYKSQSIRHNDRNEASPLDKSSFEWRVVNYRFFEDGIRLFTDGTFSISKVGLEYIRQTKYIHNAQDYIGGTYELPDGTVLTGVQSSELPSNTHQEIVDLAVLIASGNLNMPTYNYKMNKINITK